jgi:hypothetical protein
MNLTEFVGHKQEGIGEAAHRAWYKEIVEKLGYQEVRDCIPLSAEEIREAYKKDRYFNNIRIDKWDRWAGFICRDGGCTLVGSWLTDRVFRKHGIDCFSNSQCVCILKECARIEAESETQEEKNI